MKSDWTVKLIEDIDFYIGDGNYSSKYPKSSEFISVGIPFFSASDIKNGRLSLSSVRYISTELHSSLKKGHVKKDDVLIVTRGNGCGGTALVDSQFEDANINAQLVLIRQGNEVAGKYLYYYMSHMNFTGQMNGFITGSAQPQMPIKSIKKIPIVIPPIPTQKKIAHILSTLDDKIELNRKMNQTLEEMAQAIFKSWFVDFDPVHAKMACTNEKELQQAAKELGISKEILDLFPNEFEESELGMIPKGWAIAKIEKILKRYKAPKRYKKDAVESYGKTIVLEQGADIILGYHNHDGEFEATISEPMFIFGDHTCVMKLSTKPFSISENVIPLSGCIRNGYWTYYAAHGQQTFQEYRRHWSELIVKDIVLADEVICDFFAEQVQSLILKIEQNISENNELIMTRDTLLPKLLSGELDVSELEMETL